MTDRIVIAAPAKVNLFLAVGAPRADGYHELVTVFQALDLHDVVTVAPAARLDVTCVPDLGLPPCDNLAAVAARVLGGILDREPAVAIHVRKHIPVGGGLGGGSADAAAVLAGLARMWGLAPDDERLLQAARAVGADVAFFLSGGTALFTGRGDLFERRLPTPPLNVVLVNPNVGVPTARAYAAFDDLGPAASAPPDAMLAALDRGDAASVAAALHDELTEAAVSVAPVVGEALSWLRDAPGVLGAAMSGSGGTVFGICADARGAATVAGDAAGRGWWSAATTGSHHGVRLLEADEAGDAR